MEVSSITDRTPFTYVITHLATGKRYYGARYSRGCQPSDLWTQYFTSSRVIRQLVKVEGKAAFKAEVRKVFSSIEVCLEWELKVLTRLHVGTNGRWYNKSAGGKRFYSVLDREKNPNFGKHWHLPQETRNKIATSLSGRILLESHRLKIAAAVKGSGNPMFGKVVSLDTRNKISEANRKRKQSESTRRKISESQLGEKNHNYGKSTPQEVKDRISKTQGKLIWINNGILSSRIKPENWLIFESKDWKLGRKRGWKRHG